MELNTSYIKRVENGGQSESTSLSGKESPLKKSLVSIHKIKLCDFIDALIDKDRSVLSEEEFERAYQQYCDELITTKDRYRLGLILEIKNLQYKTEYVKAALTYLKYEYNEDIAKGLITIQATESLMPADDPDKLEGWFKRLTGRVKMWAGLMTAKAEELNQVKTKDDGELTRDHFDDMLLELSSMLKFQIDDQKMTVSQYISAIKRYRKLVDKLQK